MNAIQTLLVPHSAKVYAITRIIAGLLFFNHGIAKFGILGSPPPEMNPMIYTAAAIEIVGGLLIAVGFFTRWAAFISSGMMAVAYFLIHIIFMGNFANILFPLLNGGESAILYCWYFLLLASQGPGIWSVDATQNRG